MADIRKRTGSKGTTYQVRYPRKKSSGYDYATFNTLKEARAFTENLGSVRHTEGGRLSVTDAVQKWLDLCEKVGRDGREAVEPTTLIEYERRAEVIRSYAWEKYIGDLVPSDVVHFRNWLLQNKSRDLARRTLSSFHSVLIEMKRQGFVADDPAAGISIRSDGRYEEDDRAVRIPTDAEIRALLKAADRIGEKNEQLRRSWLRYRPMIYLAVFTGMRPSEYRGLAWSNVAADRVHVRQRADRLNRIGPVKSRAGRRTIYLPEMVGEMIAAWKTFCPASQLGLVFPTSEGKPMALNNFARRCWEPLMKEAGLVDPDPNNPDGPMLPRFTPYALRHYFASKLIEKGNDLKFIQTAMGHSDIQITLNVYGHLLKDKEPAHKVMAEAFASDLLSA